MSAADEQPVTLAEARTLFAPFADQASIVIAVSGGPDSTALLWLAAQWRKQRKSGPDILAVTVDHGLRAESKSEASAVKRLARSLDVPHRILRWTGAKPKTGIQEAARNARYALIAAEATKAGARHVLTAHTLDDQAETVLLRLVRGSGPAGLQAMSDLAPYPGDSRLALARPLLTLPKVRLIATLRNSSIPFADDASNRDPKFTRPRLRQIMPVLAGEGLTAERLATLARRLRRADAAIRQAVAVAMRQVSIAPSPGTTGEGRRFAFERDGFFALPAEIGMRLLGEAIGSAGNEGPVELGKLETLFEALVEAQAQTKAQTKAQASFRRTLAGAVVTIRRTDLTVEQAPARRARPGKPAARRIPALTTRKTGPFSEAGTR